MGQIEYRWFVWYSDFSPNTTRKLARILFRGGCSFLLSVETLWSNYADFSMLVLEISTTTGFVFKITMQTPLTGHCFFFWDWMHTPLRLWMLRCLRIILESGRRKEIEFSSLQIQKMIHAWPIFSPLTTVSRNLLMNFYLDSTELPLIWLRCF